MIFGYIVGIIIGYVLGWNSKKVQYLKTATIKDEKQ